MKMSVVHPGRVRGGERAAAPTLQILKLREEKTFL